MNLKPIRDEISKSYANGNRPTKIYVSKGKYKEIHEFLTSFWKDRDGGPIVVGRLGLLLFGLDVIQSNYLDSDDIVVF